MHPHVVVHLGEDLEAIAEDTAELRIVVVGHLVYRVLAGIGIDLVDAIEEVVADVDVAIGMQQEVVHL